MLKFYMKTLKFEEFNKKYNIKNDTKNESQLQSFCIYAIYPRGSKIYLDE